jgi:hypothetical protein
LVVFRYDILLLLLPLKLLLFELTHFSNVLTFFYKSLVSLVVRLV